MAMEVSSDRTVCSRCGQLFGRVRGNFNANYSELYKGVGHMHICKNCLNDIYGSYLSQSKNSKMALRALCRKLNWYWSESIYNSVIKTNKPEGIVGEYSRKLAGVSYVGKSYDDTLKNEGTFWNFYTSDEIEEQKIEYEEKIQIPNEAKTYWGFGFSDEQYYQLDERKKYYESKFPEIFNGEAGLGNDVLIRQLCIQEVSNVQDMSNGKSTAQGITALNNIIGSLNLKPSQKVDDSNTELSKSPIGVLAKIIEDRHPIKHDSKRENELIRYVLIWFYGHGCKSQGINNVYSKMYEKEMDRLRVKHPEYNDIDDDDEFLSNVFGASGDTNLTSD